jgi:hypothetical protein
VCLVMLVWIWVQCGVVFIAWGSSQRRTSPCYNAINRLRGAIPPSSRVGSLMSAAAAAVECVRCRAATDPSTLLKDDGACCCADQAVFQAGPMITVGMLCSFLFGAVLMHAASRGAFGHTVLDHRRVCVCVLLYSPSWGCVEGCVWCLCVCCVCTHWRRPATDVTDVSPA